jgi:TonB-linked SusC/RagA family outer membrane protein
MFPALLRQARRLSWAVLAATVAFPAAIQAQDALVISGRVTDETGAPLATANVYLSGTNIATFSGDDGRYQLVVPAAAVTGEARDLIASLIGYRSVQVRIVLSGDVLTQDFSLALDPIGLEGIVAIGQGLTAERRRLANAISTVPGDLIQERYSNNMVANLAAQAPSVYVQSSGGEATAGAYIQIRGSKSIEGGTQPLFVVDGTIINNDSDQSEDSIWGTVVQNRAADINPEDIASVEILKGPSAAAIYGAQGANGAVLITTKSGSAGQTQITLQTNYSIDNATSTQPLQNNYSTTNSPSSIRSWGAALSCAPNCSRWEGDPFDDARSSFATFDHSKEMFVTGNRWDTDLSISGGTERTTYFFSGGYTNSGNAIYGPSGLNTINFRLKGSHLFFPSFSVGGNVAYTNQSGNAVQQGSNLSGLLLGAFRTPPDIDNVPFVTEDGNQRSWYCVLFDSCDDPTAARLFDNPFWVAENIPNTTEVGRVFGNVRFDWEPFSWLTITDIFGGDYANDSRLSVFPKQNSEVPDGQLIRSTFNETSWDNTLLFTGAGDVSEDFGASVTLGYNLRQENVENSITTAQNVIEGADQLDFAVTKTPDEFRSNVRNSGLFVNATFDVWDQLFIGGGARYEGSSTFGGGEGSWFWFPNANLAWEFTRALGVEGGAFSFGKIRGAWGEAGTPPPVFSNVSGFEKTAFEDGWIEIGLESIYQGREGVVSETFQGNQDIKPEVTREIEGGLDLAFLDSRVSVGVTYFDQHTRDAILFLPIPESTGFSSFPENGAEFTSKGWEFTLNLIPFQGRNFTWEIQGFYSNVKSEVTDLLGAEVVGLNGFTGSASSVIFNRCGPASDEPCPYGAIWADDFIRFGRGETYDIDGDGVRDDIDAAFPNAAAGTLFIAEDGFPRLADNLTGVGNPNPEGLASLRMNFTILQNLSLSFLFDGQWGSTMWNGTRGALYSYGTHAFTEPFHCANGRDCGATEGVPIVYEGEGPGAGMTVYQNTATVGPSSIFNGFNGPTTQFIEDNDFIKFRDFRVAYDFTQRWVNSISLNRVSVFFAGRNLWTDTDYTGLDPESNLTGQNGGRGLEYFNNPQIRSWVFGISFIY